MKYVLDTDHISLLEYRTGSAYAAFVLQLNIHSGDEITVSAISFHEQVRGAHNKIGSAKRSAELLRGYELLVGIIERYRTFPVLNFDAAALAEYDKLKRMKLRVGTLDLRIASIALSKDMTVVTRNVSDFGRVPKLRVEDWTQ